MAHPNHGLAAAGFAVTLVLPACSDGGHSSNPNANSAGAASSTGGASSAGTTGAGGATSSAGAAGQSGSSNTGGTMSQGGAQAAGGTVATGGASGASGAAATGGATGAGGAGTGGGVTAATISGWMDKLPYGTQSLSAADRSAIIDAIIESCTAFAPSGANWITYCEAVVTGAILQESSYNAASVVTDGYGTRSITGGTANDPTVGLLQIRFSSTVNDYNAYGPLAKIAGIGCTWPPELAAHQSEGGDSAFWAQGGGTTYLTFLQSIPCNIGLATWYYFMNATGNGGASAVYAYAYCQGQGVAGSLPIGLLSHLQGPAGPHPPDTANTYVTNNEKWFALFLGAVTPDPYALTTTLAPETTKYCR